MLISSYTQHLLILKYIYSYCYYELFSSTHNYYFINLASTEVSSNKSYVYILAVNEKLSDGISHKNGDQGFGK